ncbi:hypothetical protein P7D22_03865 [Lichenihabitans sp. Uapishka_5]|uniref:hypothetical protein n=1 Tax=Lichenihabitans sp. Uapishka_5 TaxID=3037302 RepID=UPI0029E81392|nr:hypothetical protein [Lichenihabitans sp. Uapishka_5]MDX7950316.1 hypothetical protein [Lichenihabitans sp. Uapishka_5]
MTEAALTPEPHLVVFGRDNAGKPHASWFDQASAALATKAAGLMNMQAVPIESDALRALVSGLPKGRVFSSGRAFTPFVAAKVYGQLEAITGGAGSPSATEPATGVETAAAKPRPTLQVVGSDAGEPEGGAPASPPSPPSNPGPKPPVRPTRIEDVGIGSLVLATTGPAEGWWEAEVIGSNGSMVTLRWRDFTEPTVVRRRTELGFLPPVPA